MADANEWVESGHHGAHQAIEMGDTLLPEAVAYQATLEAAKGGYRPGGDMGLAEIVAARTRMREAEEALDPGPVEPVEMPVWYGGGRVPRPVPDHRPRAGAALKYR